MQDNMSDTQGELLGLIGGVIPVPVEFSFIFAIQPNGSTACHEVDNVLYDFRKNQIVWFTHQLESYNHLTEALEDWGMRWGMTELLSQRLEERGELDDFYKNANSALRMRLQQTENELSRLREEHERLEEWASEMAGKLLELDVD